MSKAALISIATLKRMLLPGLTPLFDRSYALMEVSAAWCSDDPPRSWSRVTACVHCWHFTFAVQANACSSLFSPSLLCHLQAAPHLADGPGDFMLALLAKAMLAADANTERPLGSFAPTILASWDKCSPVTSLPT